MRRFVEIDGKRYLWRELLKLRREQKELEPEKQLTLFELKTERSAGIAIIVTDGRYSEPTLFKID